MLGLRRKGDDVHTAALPILRKPGVPIIFAYADLNDVWTKSFLDIVLRQAALASPGSDIIILTDAERPCPPGIIQVPLGEHHAAVLHFKRLYRHTSSNRFKFELFCFTRWFCIREFVRRHGIARFCVFDCDVLLFSPVETFVAAFGDHLAGNWSWANTISSLRALDLICGHFEAVFQDRGLFASITKRNRVGAAPLVSDMVALFDLAERDSTFLNQHTLLGDGFDDNINFSSGGLFAMDGPIKALTVGADGIPRARRARDGVVVPFHFLHFQGPAKNLIAKFAWQLAKPSPLELT